MAEVVLRANACGPLVPSFLIKDSARHRQSKYGRRPGVSWGLHTASGRDVAVRFTRLTA